MPSPAGASRPTGRWVDTPARPAYRSLMVDRRTGPAQTAKGDTMTELSRLTRAIRTGLETDPAHGAVVPPIYLPSSSNV